MYPYRTCDSLNFAGFGQEAADSNGDAVPAAMVNPSRRNNGAVGLNNYLSYWPPDSQQHVTQ